MSQRAVNKQTDWTGRSQLQSLRAVVRQKKLELKARAGANWEEKMAALANPARVLDNENTPLRSSLHLWLLDVSELWLRDCVLFSCNFFV